MIASMLPRMPKAALTTAGAAAVCLVSMATGLDIPIGEVGGGSIRFLTMPGHFCGNGEIPWYGLVEPQELLHEDAFFFEIMGGAVCFNQSSCEDSWLGAWLGIMSFLKEKKGLGDAEIGLLTSQTDINLGLMEQLRPGYLPFSDSHPYWGRRGIYFVTCTADVTVGRHNATYEDGNVIYHHGGINFKSVMEGVHAKLPNLTDVAVYGGSGGGVSASVWMQGVADTWPKASVTAFVDSGFHMMPGGTFFQFFWDNVAWSTGPGGDNAGKYTDIMLPDFDWRDRSAITKQLQEYDGRVKIVYIACSEDYIVYGDRALMSQYSSFDSTTMDQLPDMWDFLTNLHKCSPPGTAFSYIANCDKHHMSLHGWPTEADIEGTIRMQTFTENVLKGLPPDASDPDRVHFWFEEKSIENDGGTCPTTRTSSTQTTTETTTGTNTATETSKTTTATSTTSTTNATGVETQDVSLAFRAAVSFAFVAGVSAAAALAVAVQG